MAFAFSIHVFRAVEFFAAHPDLESRALVAMLILMGSMVPALVAVLGRYVVDESVAPPPR